MKTTVRTKQLLIGQAEKKIKYCIQMCNASQYVMYVYRLPSSLFFFFFDGLFKVVLGRVVLTDTLSLFLLRIYFNSFLLNCDVLQSVQQIFA